MCGSQSLIYINKTKFFRFNVQLSNVCSATEFTITILCYVMKRTPVLIHESLHITEHNARFYRFVLTCASVGTGLQGVCCHLSLLLEFYVVRNCTRALVNELCSDRLGYHTLLSVCLPQVNVTLRALTLQE